MEEIKVKYFVEDLEPLTYVADKSDWIDLRAAETVTLQAGEFRLIPLGVAIACRRDMRPHRAPQLHLPQLRNFADQLHGRGGLQLPGRQRPMAHARLCHPGRDHRENARICQFRIVRNQPHLTFTRVEHLDGPDRGGFGSTGK